MQTLGALIDALCTVDLKMFNMQETLYQIRHMTFQEFREYISDPNNQFELYNTFKKACDLNYQRNQLIDEIDDLTIRIVEDGLSGACLDKYIQKKHKTY